MESVYRLQTKKPHLLCLILLISFPSISVVLISPALPAISNALSISNAYAQQLITLAIVGYTFGQLLYSPFANRYGRKVAIYIGLAVYVLSCVVCLVGIHMRAMPILLFGRLLMALGASVGMTISFTVINDFYHPHQARTVVSYTVLSYAFIPALAVLTGGFITSHFSWVGCFYFYLAYSAVVMIATWRLPETMSEKNLSALNFTPLLRNFKSAFSHGRLIIFSLIYGVMTGYIYVTATGAPFIGIDILGYSPMSYGLLLLLPYFGQALGSLTGGKVNSLFTEYTVLNVAYAAVVVGSILMLGCFAVGWVNAWTLVVPIFVIMFGLPISYSVVTVMALKHFDDKATGSSVMSFLAMAVTLVITLLFSTLPSAHVLVLPITYVTLSIVATSVLFVAKRRYAD